jgi:hypothetical protein
MDIENLVIKSLMITFSLDKAYCRLRNRIVSPVSKTYSRSRNIFSFTKPAFDNLPSFQNGLRGFTNLFSGTGLRHVCFWLRKRVVQ